MGGSGSESVLLTAKQQKGCMLPFSLVLDNGLPIGKVRTSVQHFENMQPRYRGFGLEAENALQGCQKIFTLSRCFS